jgi:hypothetical protein
LSLSAWLKTRLRNSSREKTRVGRQASNRSSRVSHSDRVLPNWECGYRAALQALSEPARLGPLLRLAADTVKHGTLAVQAAKDQFQVALLAKAAAESGVLRYISILAERGE